MTILVRWDKVFTWKILFARFVRPLEVLDTLDFYFSPEKPLKSLEFQIYPWKIEPL
jgi:hypothetical protein